MERGITFFDAAGLQQALTAYESEGIGYYHSLSVEKLGEAELLANQVENARACAIIFDG